MKRQKCFSLELKKGPRKTPKMLPKCMQNSPNGTTSKKRGDKRQRTENDDTQDEARYTDSYNCSLDYTEHLSEYERQRLENIKQNQRFLYTLQLPQITQALKPKAKSTYQGINKVKAVDVQPLRKSLRLQKKDPNAPLLSKASDAVTEENETLPCKTEGPIQIVPLNVDDFKLPEKLLKLWNEDSIKQEHQPDLKRYQSVLQKMSIDSSAVVKVVQKRIFSAAFHPCSSSLLMAAGDKSGHLGLWNFGSNWGDDGVLLFEPHSRPISCMAFSSQPTKLLSVSYDGFTRSMDLEKAVFEEVYYSDSGLKSFDFLSSDGSTLLIGHWDGDVVIVDCRTTTSYESLHTLDRKNIRSVHVHPVHRQYFVVAESRSVHIYDCRFLKRRNSQHVCELPGHSLSISSAFFSPTSGNRVLTTCMDNKIRVFDTSRMVTTVPLLNTTKHFMQTGRWLSKLSAVWDPKQEDCFVIGSLGRPRCIQVYHESCGLLQSLQNEDHLTTVCSITAFHPNRHVLLGGNGSGRLHVFSVS